MPLKPLIPPGRRLRFLLHLLSALLLAWVLIIFGISASYLHVLLHPPCLISTGADIAGLQSISLALKEGQQLQGWWLPPRESTPGEGAVILLLGGHGANRDAMLPQAKILAEQGYGFVTLDYRHCAGQPTRKKTASLGYHEVAELQAMAAFARQQDDVTWLGVWGFSVGGTTAIRGAATLPDLRAVIAEGNYANLYDEITASKTTYFPYSLLETQIQGVVSLLYWLQTGISPAKVSPIDSLAALSDRSIFMIHGEYEIERTRGYQQYQQAVLTADSQAAVLRELWVVPGTGHGGYKQAYPQEYKQRVLDFLLKSRPEP